MQETAKLEAEAFELEQKTAIAAEAKAVLDSWVRYEGQVKQRQQKELAESIIAKVKKELENPKALQQILQQSIADVESKSHYTSPLSCPEITSSKFCLLI
jgi:F-type H+-transporting ATPase subunit b